MGKEDKARFKLIKRMLGPAKIYEIRLAVISSTEWAASAALVGGEDRRFRFTKGQLFDEAQVGDARV